MRRRLLAAPLVAMVSLLAGLSVSNPRPAEAICIIPAVMGDMDGTREVFTTGALWILRKNNGLLLPNNGHACSPEDVDCSGTRNAVDALKIMRFVAGLEVTQNEPCVDIGDEVPE